MRRHAPPAAARGAEATRRASAGGTLAVALAAAALAGAADSPSLAAPSPPAAAASGAAAAAPSAGPPHGSTTPPAGGRTRLAPLAGRGPGHGLAPLPGGLPVPEAWLPPGSDASAEPSEVVFPPQTLALRFNHYLHVVLLGQGCRVCHQAAWRSTEASDRLLPDPARSCDNCHDVEHSRRGAVRAGSEPNGQCSTCHLGAGRSARGAAAVARTIIPPPALKMNHRAHLVRDIRCPHCHGMVEQIERAERQQLPRMAGCLTCHAMSGAARGKARGACSTCHPTTPSGQLATKLPGGTLRPPRWLHGAEHTPDWLARHKLVAAANSSLCASCHDERSCSRCHDGRVRPRAVHPGDYLSMHPVAARQDNPRCVSCHQLQTFCADCHRRLGVARDAPSANRAAGRRFHPPPRTWTTGPRSPQHHAWQAQRNLNACVSCHSERDCATCHATKGLRGGAGIDPHPAGFEAGCASAFARNPRPCLVCHRPADARLERCR